jgi:nitronate monooxygenase
MFSSYKVDVSIRLWSQSGYGRNLTHIYAGIESGGHGSANAPPLSSFLQAVLTAIPDGPVVIAAGGVSTGAQIAALLTQGAAGVVLGTRFLFTHECEYSPAMKEVLVSSDLNATERSMAFDEVFRTMGWPEGINGRAIANDVYRDYLAGIVLEERIKRYDEGKAEGDNKRLIIWAGVGVGLTDEIKSASVCLLLYRSVLRPNDICRMCSMNCTRRQSKL